MLRIEVGTRLGCNCMRRVLFFLRFLVFVAVRVEIVGEAIPNAMQEVRRNSQ